MNRNENELSLLGHFSDVGFHQLPIKIYYEDTDAAGIVYYANYLNYFERGRTNFLSLLGIDKIFLEDRMEYKFLVRSCSIKYLKPAYLNQTLTILTSIIKLRNQMIDFDQRLYRDNDIIVLGKVRIVYVDSQGGVSKLPARVISKLRDKTI